MSIKHEDKAEMPNTNAQIAQSKESAPAVGELIAYSDTDPVLAAKMQLVNDAINQIGLTSYHWKLFCLTGMGYAVDSLLGLLMGIANTQLVLEFNPSFIRGGQISIYTGLLVGALFWGLSADLTGRKWAFNLSLLVAALFAIFAGAAPTYTAWCIFVAFSGFGSGGNLALDTTIFLEFIPATKQWLVTLMAMWWGVGQTISGLLAWGFMPNFSCESQETCTRANNMGWRYLYYTGGSFVLVLSVARVLVIRFHETPKYLLCAGKDAETVKLLQDIARKGGRQCDLQAEHLERLGTIRMQEKNRTSLWEIAGHYRGLFETRRLGVSTCLVWFSWTLIGLAWPLFYIFLPEYLASRGAQFGEDSPAITWRNYLLAQISAIFGPILGGFMCNSKLGRKYTMVIGAVISMAFLFAYTHVRNNAQNVAFNCVVSFTVNIYYGALYAYSPEVLPSAHRATGNGTAVALNRLMGIMSGVIGTYASTASAVPVYICAALFVVMAFVSAVFPFEPQKSQSA